MKHRRNDPCFCGSGNKYKRCHGSLIRSSNSPNHHIEKPTTEVVKSLLARQRQRQDQQGYGRPIISTVQNGFRIVAVGSRVYWSKKWDTFHDFLIEYIVHALGQNWGNEELKKPPQQRHPIMHWYGIVADRMSRRDASINSAPMNGAEGAYLGLAYNLYLLAHNVKLEELLVKRLKNASTFHGAYYEAMVAAAFIKQGFTIELEDESDSSGSHCEFTARSPVTKKSFSIEAKAREVPGILGKPNNKVPPNSEAEHAIKNVRRQVRNALEKSANHQRMVFVDLNFSNEDLIRNGSTAVPEKALDLLETEKDKMMVRGEQAPPAYIYVTNAPFHYVTESERGFYIVASAMGFKMSGFGRQAPGVSIRRLASERLAHQDAWSILAAFTKMSVPSTFDGEMPQAAFNKLEQDRLLIGSTYLVPNAAGSDEPGVLTTGIVIPGEKIAYGTFKLRSGAHILCAVPLTEMELEMYKDSPDTFFGELIDAPLVANDPVEFYLRLLEIYKSTSKETLLRHMFAAEDFSNLATMERAELIEVYCERLTASAFRH